MTTDRRLEWLIKYDFFQIYFIQSVDSNRNPSKPFSYRQTDSEKFIQKVRSPRISSTFCGTKLEDSVSDFQASYQAAETQRVVLKRIAKKKRKNHWNILESLIVDLRKHRQLISDKEAKAGGSPRGPEVRTSSSKAGGAISSPGHKLRSHMPQGQKTKPNQQKHYGNEFNKDFESGPR